MQLTQGPEDSDLWASSTQIEELMLTEVCGVPGSASLSFVNTSSEPISTHKELYHFSSVNWLPDSRKKKEKRKCKREMVVGQFSLKLGSSQEFTPAKWYLQELGVWMCHYLASQRKWWCHEHQPIAKMSCNTSTGFPCLRVRENNSWAIRSWVWVEIPSDDQEFALFWFSLCANVFKYILEYESSTWCAQCKCFCASGRGNEGRLGLNLRLLSRP